MRAATCARIDSATVARVHAQIPASAFFEKELGVRITRNRGWVDLGRCIFHPDRTPGSFKAHMPDGRWACFACGKQGDVIQFVELRYGLSFPDAVEALARAWGICV